MPCTRADMDAVRAEPWSAGRWCCYYRDNAESLMPLPWHRGAGLTDAERDAVAASLQDFQVGEQSEGRNLQRRAAAYGERVDDPEYPEAIRLFIAEEQRHARDLGRFLRLAGVTLLEGSRLDRAFRLLRRLAGLGQMIVVLLIAETIGKVYYKAIRLATGSPLLRRLCEQLLRDEVQHMRFHAERLAILRRNHSRSRRWLARGWHRLLFGGTCLLVWVKHRRALRAGGYGLARFWRECRAELRGVLRTADPRRYRWQRSRPAPISANRAEVYEPSTPGR